MFTCLIAASSAAGSKDEILIDAKDGPFIDGARTTSNYAKDLFILHRQVVLRIGSPPKSGRELAVSAGAAIACLAIGIFLTVHFKAGAGGLHLADMQHARTADLVIMLYLAALLAGGVSIGSFLKAHRRHQQAVATKLRLADLNGRLKWFIAIASDADANSSLSKHADIIFGDFNGPAQGVPDKISAKAWIYGNSILHASRDEIGRIMKLFDNKPRSISAEAADLIRQAKSYFDLAGTIDPTKTDDEDKEQLAGIQNWCSVVMLDLSLVAAVSDADRDALGMTAYHEKLIALTKSDLTELRMVFAKANRDAMPV